MFVMRYQHILYGRKILWVQNLADLFENDIYNTVWPEILAGNLFWRIGGFESNPPIFPSAKLFTVCRYM